MKKFIAFCAISVWLCLWSRAQFNFFDQAFLGQAATSTSMAPPDPSSIPGLEFWWVSSDLTNNLIVTNWIDRIQGSVLTNGANTLRPTNSTSGVGFNGTTFLTNYALVISNLTSMVLIYTPHADADGDDILGTIPAGNRYNYIGAKFGITASRFYDEVLNVTKDSVIGMRSPDTSKGYTNGILFSANIAHAGASEVWAGLAGPPGDNHGRFHLLEFMWYTNDISTNSTWVATIHTYATNKYGFTP